MTANATSSMPTRVLFVCSANLCRSVTAAELAHRASQAAAGTWQFESAGTHVSPDYRLPSAVAQALDELEIPRRERPLAVSRELVQQADLVLVAERHHRSTVLRRHPAAARRTFTLLEFVRWVDAGRRAMSSANGSSAEHLLRLAQVGRSHVDVADGETIDIADPVEAGTFEATMRCAAVIDDAVTRLVSA